jgi:TonB family protein
MLQTAKPSTIGTLHALSVSIDSVNPLQCLFRMLVLSGALLASTTIQAGVCKAEGPLLTDKTGKPTWLDTKALLKRSTHCLAPRMPALAGQARIEGQVLVDILVDQHGKVACVELIHGHPMLAGPAIDAAKDWTFRPKKQKGHAVSWYGHLRFQFSSAGTLKGESSCTVAHW